MKPLDWLKKNLTFLLGGLAIFIMIACFVSGCHYHKFHYPCPEPSIVTNKVILRDTITHFIDKWHYSQRTDTVIYNDTIIQPVDTLQILADYFALHVYFRTWEDTLLKVDIRDTVTQNKFLQNEFKYRILRPQTITTFITDNSVHYSKYVYLGLDIPFYNAEFSEVTALYAFNKGFLGAGYAPFQKGLSIKTGFKIIKFK
jgi:hypothetical protein